MPFVKMPVVLIIIVLMTYILMPLVLTTANNSRLFVMTFVIVNHFYKVLMIVILSNKLVIPSYLGNIIKLKIIS